MQVPSVLPSPSNPATQFSSTMQDVQSLAPPASHDLLKIRIKKFKKGGCFYQVSSHGEHAAPSAKCFGRQGHV